MMATDGYSGTKHGGSVEARIEHIAELMRSLRWRTGETGKVLARQWDLSEQRLRELAAEASRRVRAEVTDPDRVSVSVGVVLESALVGALEDKDWRAVAAVAKTWGEIAGAIKAPRNTEPSPERSIEDDVTILEAALSAAKSRRGG
jgi:hypothetical protein